MGKPVKQARAEVEKSASLCEWYAKQGPAMLAPEPTQVDNGEAHIHYRPSGMILAIMPWNFPVWQILRGAVPALLAGNTFLLKPAPNVMGTTYKLKQAVLKAGFPAGLAHYFEDNPTTNINNQLTLFCDMYKIAWSSKPTCRVIPPN